MHVVLVMKKISLFVFVAAPLMMGCVEQKGPYQRAGEHLDEAASEVSGSDRARYEQGPAEKAGESMDEATRKVGRAVKHAGEDIEDSAR
jgi:hypothetical protein